MTCVFLREGEGDLDTQMNTGGEGCVRDQGRRDWAEAAASQGTPGSAGSLWKPGRARKDFFLENSEEAWLC